MIAWAREQVGDASRGLPRPCQSGRDPPAVPRDERRRARHAGPVAGARPVVLHRRDHGDRGARSRRQPRRRRPLRRADWHVQRRGDPGVRVLARPRADPGRDGRAADVSGRAAARGRGRPGHAVRRRAGRGRSPLAADLRARRPPRRGLSRARQAREAVQVRLGATRRSRS